MALYRMPPAASEARNISASRQGSGRALRRLAGTRARILASVLVAGLLSPLCQAQPPASGNMIMAPNTASGAAAGAPSASAAEQHDGHFVSGVADAQPKKPGPQF